MNYETTWVVQPYVEGLRRDCGDDSRQRILRSLLQHTVDLTGKGILDVGNIGKNAPIRRTTSREFPVPESVMTRMNSE